MKGFLSLPLIFNLIDFFGRPVWLFSLMCEYYIGGVVLNILKLKKFILESLGMTITSFMTALGYQARTWYCWQYQNKIPNHAVTAIKHYFDSRRVEYND